MKSFYFDGTKVSLTLLSRNTNLAATKFWCRLLSPFSYFNLTVTRAHFHSSIFFTHSGHCKCALLWYEKIFKRPVNCISFIDIRTENYWLFHNSSTLRTLLQIRNLLFTWVKMTKMFTKFKIESLKYISWITCLAMSVLQLTNYAL